MPYQRETYRALINAVGEGALADKLLAKWLQDDGEGTAKFINLATDMYRVDLDSLTAMEVQRQEVRRHELSERLNGGTQPSEVRRWEVVLWYASLGYQNEAIAAQLHCGVETVKHHLRTARNELNLVGASLTKLVAVAIRQGIIP
jgi:DNA-binding NarL/FixJ family response regulator